MTNLPDLKAQLLENSEVRGEYEKIGAEPLLTRQCSKCGEWKPLADFHAHKTGKYGRAAACKVCEKLRRAHYRARPEVKAKRREYYREYAHHYRKRLDVKAKRHDIDTRYKLKSVVRAAQRERSAVHRLANNIARETCKKLGIDVLQLAKEQHYADKKR